MEWKDKYSKKTKPSYDELLAFLQPHIRDLFLLFDQEMRRQSKEALSLLNPYALSSLRRCFNRDGIRLCHPL
ncbi:MAG: hypothetical protein FWF05_05715 [Oscillospiraceae bacterium]|nr:hypothetical protein [Oscillospiraceae bacterium]